MGEVGEGEGIALLLSNLQISFNLITWFTFLVDPKVYTCTPKVVDTKISCEKKKIK